MKNKKLLFLLAGLTLVSCGGGNTPSVSENPSSETPSSSVQESVSEGPTLFERFVDAYDALGNNYYAFDYLGALYSDGEYSVSFNQMITTPKGSVNMATKSGIAIGAAADGSKVGYRFGIDLQAEEVDPEAMFLPSHSPATFYYYGMYADQAAVVPMTEDNYDYFYRIADSSVIQSFSDSIYTELGSKKLPRFNNMFVEGTDAEGNPTFTTDNIAFAMEALDKFSFGRFEGYSETYDSDTYTHFSNSLNEYGLEGVSTIVTLIEGDGYDMLYVEVYLSAFSTEYPYISRQLVGLSTLPDYELEGVDLVNYIVPESFYEEGPGAESEESKAQRALLKSQLDNLMPSNYTIELTLGQAVGGGQFISKVVDDTCFSSGTEEMAYSYYYVSTDVNKELGGIYQFLEENGEGFEEPWLNTLDYAQRMADAYASQGATLSEDGLTLTLQGRNIDMDDYVKSLYDEIFNYKYLLSDEYNAQYVEAYGINYWELAYGSDWIDQFYYSERTGKFLLSNYFIKGAFLGQCIPVMNMNDCITAEFLLGDTAEDTPIVSLAYYVGEYADFGLAVYSNVGTTKLSNVFGTYINEKYGFNYQVEAAE